MIIYLVAIAIIFLASVITFFVLNSGQVPVMKVVGYLLLFGIIMTVAGFAGLVPAFSGSIVYFFVLQFFFLLMGYLAYFLLRKNVLGELADAHEKLSKVMFVLAAATLGMVGFTPLFDHFPSTGDLAPYYSISILTFVLPQFLSVSFRAYCEIPQEIYKVWYYPEEEKEIDFDKIDTSKVFMLEMEFSKSINDPKLVNSKAKAPLGMMFGDWFMSFIENYNHKFDEDPIQYIGSDNMPHGWIFYVKPSFLGTPKYIDPDLSIAGNKISEKNVIIARRVGLV